MLQSQFFNHFEIRKGEEGREGNFSAVMSLFLSGKQS
jgi:hypothetical protein